MNYWWPLYQMDEQINKWHTVNEWLIVEKTTNYERFISIMNKRKTDRKLLKGRTDKFWIMIERKDKIQNNNNE